jgi:hypothetical protein
VRRYDAGVMFSISALFVMMMNAYQGMKAREAADGGTTGDVKWWYPY